MLVIHGFYVEIFTEADQYLYVCVYVMLGDSHTSATFLQNEMVCLLIGDTKID